jgi:hypothetical protein
MHVSRPLINAQAQMGGAHEGRPHPARLLAATSTHAARVAAFVLVRGGVMAAAFVAALPRLKVLRPFDAPFIALVTLSGEVSVMYEATGPVIRPKRIK